jgi:hypothetical protein
LLNGRCCGNNWKQPTADACVHAPTHFERWITLKNGIFAILDARS